MKLYALAFAATLAAPAYAADDCKLKQVADLDITVSADGAPTIPVTIDGDNYPFLLSLAATTSVIGDDFANRIGLKIQDVPNKPKIIANNHAQSPRVAILPDLHIGAAGATDYPMPIEYRPMPPGIDGYIGLDLLSNDDIELDMANHKLRLFSQAHCEGQVVYWNKLYDVLPFQKPTGYVTRVPNFDVLLDGKAFQAMINPQMATGLAGTLDVEEQFGFKPDDPALVELPGQWGRKTFHYPFKSLVMGGVTIANPDIVLFDQSIEQKCDGKVRKIDGFTRACFAPGNLSLGRKELSALHLYFAFKEQKLYVTAADPPPNPL